MQLTAFQTLTSYQRIGQQGPFLVMLHGWGHSFETFSQIIPTLADTFVLIIPDLPAFGKSANPHPLADEQTWNSQTYVSWLVDFLSQTIGDHPFYLAGHSFGGKIAALYAAKTNPPNLRHLILMDSSGLPEPLTPKEQLVQTIAHLTPSLLKDMLRKKTVSGWLKAMGVAADYQQANSTQQAILRRVVREDIAAALPAITTPTTIIWGAKDETTPVSAGKRFAELIPDAKLEIIAAAAHCPFHDQPMAVVKILEELTK